MNRTSMASSSESGSQYPYPSTLNPAGLISIKLSGAHDYPLWETQMMCLFESQELVGFIDGTILTPPETTEHGKAAAAGNSVEVVANEEYRLWKRSDRLVKSWILGSLQEIVLATVLGLTTARSVWTKLHSTFGVNPQENKEEKIEEELPTQQGVEYPYPSTFNVASFVTIKLSTVNYKSWVLQILSLVDSLELRDFLMNEPPSQDNYPLWRRTDMLIRGWILGSISEDVITEVFDPDYFSSSRSIMLKIEKIFVPGINKRFLSPKPVTTNIEREEEVDTQQGIRIKEYPYPSTFNVGNVVTIKLTKANYISWVQQIWVLLEIFDMLDFLKEEPPTEAVRQTNEDIHTWKLRNQDYLLWKRTDKLLQGWIIGSISEDVMNMIITMEIFPIGTTKSLRSMMLRIEKTIVSCSYDRILHLKFALTEIENNEEEEDISISIIEYPYPSTFNVANVVTLKLTKANYELWVQQIWSLVDILQLRDFLEKKPSLLRLRALWTRTDRLLRGWILATLSEDVLKKVFDDLDAISTSRSVMIRIEKTLVEDIDKRILSKPETMREKEKSIGKYIPLYEATIAGDWEATKRILDGDQEAATAIITETGFTLLHVAVVTGKNIDFVKNIVQYLPTDALITLTDMFGQTALDIAAKISMNKCDFETPRQSIHFDHMDTYLYLKRVSSDVHDAGENAGTQSILLNAMILSEYFGSALDFVKCYPHAVEQSNHLSLMAEKPSCFRSGMSLNFVESFIYSCVPVHVHHYSHVLGGNVNGDVENLILNHSHFLNHWVHFIGVRLCKKLKLMLWDAILLVPSIKIIHQKKLAHHQVIQLVKCLCEALKSSNDEASFNRCSTEPLIMAARFGTLEVVEEILRILPHTIWSYDGSKHNITEIAVINRCEKVFNKTCQMNELQEYLKFHMDDNGNSILHLAGGMAPRDKLNLVSGAALQMQRELQWFKEVEKLSNPFLRTWKNSSKETPAMVFTREHKELVIEGEKWMKDTANSCSIAAALIITMVFAAAITVPGGNKEYNGMPVFYNDPAFLIFAVSDIVALFMSTTSLLMFLSILTARYAEEDFLQTLPKRLVFGLLTLFLSITSMVIAFSSAVYLVFGGRNGWVIIPLAALSCLPITSFVRLQFPLLIDVYSSTYGRGIFG